MSDEIRVIKENDEEVQQENPEELRLKEEMAAFNEEEGIEFQQTLVKEDLVQYNYYLLKNPSNYFRTGLMVLLGIFLIVYPIIVKQNYWIIGVGTFLVIFCLFLFVPLQKALIRRQVKKKPTESYVIDVKCASRLKYQLSSEENAPLIDYQNIYKVRKTPNYIYMHMGVYSVVIIKLDACEAREELVEFIKSKYVGTNKYKELKK